MDQDQLNTFIIDAVQQMEGAKWKRGHKVETGSEWIFLAALRRQLRRGPWNVFMVRLGGYFLPDQPLHVIRRGNNRQGPDATRWEGDGIASICQRLNRRKSSSAAP